MKRFLAIQFFVTFALLGGEPAGGETVWIGGRYFQFAGTNTSSEALYFYPHTDGVAELFTVRADGAWRGSFESRFDPSAGRFENLFNAGEVAVEFAYGPLDLQRRRPSARLLAVFMDLYDQPQPPYYLRHLREQISSALTDKDREDVAKIVEQHRTAARGLRVVGTQLKRFTAPRGSLDAPEYYRRLIADGYLDITVCGGNLYAEAWGTYNSWAFTEQFSARLKKQGFSAAAFRTSSDAVRLEKAVRLFDENIVVRITVTGGSKQPHRILRSVANFTEGFSRADVLLYHGHSNKDEGAYYLAELDSEFQRFQIGMNDTRDLVAKLQGLNARPHQIFGLQTCVSLEKYAYPIRNAFDEHYPNAHGHAGFIATPTMSQQVDFAPRYAAFVEQLTQGRGPRAIHEAMNAPKPDPHSKPLVFRGVLQPRASFLVPKGVSISSTSTVSIDGIFLTQGVGSDGAKYMSTDLFPQDAPGDVRQIVTLQKTIYALYADGSLYEASAESTGAVKACAAVRNLRAKILHICADAAGERLLLLCDDNTLRAFSPGDQSSQYSRVQLPAKSSFKAIAFDAQKNFFAQDAEKNWWQWFAQEKVFRRSDEVPKMKTASPSLSGFGLAGELILRN
jgi:hypothetical protein